MTAWDCRGLPQIKTCCIILFFHSPKFTEYSPLPNIVDMMLIAWWPIRWVTLSKNDLHFIASTYDPILNPSDFCLCISEQSLNSLQYSVYQTQVYYIPAVFSLLFLSIKHPQYYIFLIFKVFKAPEAFYLQDDNRLDNSPWQRDQKTPRISGRININILIHGKLNL